MSRSIQSIVQFIRGALQVFSVVGIMLVTSHAQRSGPQGAWKNIGIRTIVPEKSYALDELIDIAEQNNPRTRIAWEQAKSAAERAGIARSDYFPKLTGVTSSGDERIINPFPKPLAPLGYTMVEIPAVESGLGLEYTVYDFGRRKAALDSKLAKWSSENELYQRSIQDVSYRVELAYYQLVAAIEKSEADRKILETARVTQAAAEAQLENGRSTLPDVLNARAGTAEAEYDLESASGDESVARVRLREVLGLEPSDEISILDPSTAPSADALSVSVLKHVEEAVQQRPDLRAFSERINAAKADVKAAEAAFRPSIQFQSRAGSQTFWESVSQPADTTQFVWQVGLRLKWELFDGGARKHEVLERQSELRKANEELREKRDEISRDTWTAYVRLRTASRQYESAQILLKSAQSSYDASMEAYGYGVKNLVDVVTAEAKLSKARIAVVQAKFAVFTGAANLQYTVGTLLEKKSDAATSTPKADK